MQDDEGPRTEKSTTEELIKAFTEKRRRVASEQAKRDEPDYLVSIEG